jgi:hypothetical protein
MSEFYSTNTNGETISFYIPRISKMYTAEDIGNIFAINLVGSVSRVDFAPITPVAQGKRESAESVACNFQKAFVHMNCVFATENGNNIYNTVVINDSSFRFFPTADSEYWIILNNKMAVPFTNLNIHQIAENHRILEETVATQAEQLEVQRKQIEQLKAAVLKIMRM